MPQRLEYLWHGTIAVSLNYYDRSRPMNLPFGLGHARVGYIAAANHGGRPENGGCRTWNFGQWQAALILLVCHNLPQRDALLDPRRRVISYPVQRFKMGFEFIDQFDRAVGPFGLDLPQFAVS